MTTNLYRNSVLAGILATVLAASAQAQVGGEYLFGYSNDATPCYLNVTYANGTRQSFSTATSEIAAGVFNQGHWADRGVNYNPSNDNVYSNYTVGYSPSSDGNGFNDARGYFTFDLTGIGTTSAITSAELQVTEYVVESSTNQARLGIQFGHVDTDATALNYRTPRVNDGIYADLGRGDYGNAAVTANNSFSSGQLHFALNSTAINDITNHAGSWFSIAASKTLTADGPLVQPTQPVPEVGTFISFGTLIIGGLGGFLLSRRTSRR